MITTKAAKPELENHQEEYKALDELRRLQLKTLEILDVVATICKKYHIDYSLCGGSVVGAYLYKGFLPWDDDVDLMMTRSNYNRFLDVCEVELPDKYELINFRKSVKYYTLFTKIVDKTTTLVQGDIVSGVFLDITVYDKVPNNWLKRIDYSVATSAARIVSRISSNSKSKKTLLVKKFKALWPLIFRCGEAVFSGLGKIKSYSYCELYGACCRTKTYDASIFENYSWIEFEGKSYQIVSDYVHYLENRYERTDFREPKERQVPPHISYFNVSLPYKEYQESKSL